MPDRPGLRPTGDRARETLFNWIGPRIVGARVLDLYAGTGALGLEAASRGASRVILVERDAGVLDQLRTAVLHWPGAECLELIHADALSWLRQAQGPFDLVLIDPPFGAELLIPSLQMLVTRPELTTNQARIYLETAPEQLPASWPEAFELLRQKRQGRVVLNLLGWRTASP